MSPDEPTTVRPVKPIPPEVEEWVDRPYHRPVLIASAGVLGGLCYPPVGWVWLLPVAFVLLYAGLQGTIPRRAARLGFAFGTVFYLVHTYWFASFHPLALPFVLLVLGLWHAIWAWGVVRLGSNPWIMAGGWMVLEWILTRGYLAFPWSRVAAAFSPYPLWIQPVAFVGEVAWGGLLVAMFFLIGRFLLRSRGSKELVAAVLSVLLLLGAGWIRMEWTPVNFTSRNVLLVQPDVRSRYNPDSDRSTQLKVLTRITARRARPGDLVVWPETTVLGQPLSIADGGLEWSRQRRWREFFQRLVRDRFELLFGTTFYDPKPQRLDRLNGAVLLGADLRPRGYYTKRIPVPGGEHLPLMGRWNWVRRLGRMAGTLGYRAGRKGGLIPLEVANESWQIGVQICFEDAFSGYVRQQVSRGADLLVNLSNDSWSRSTASHLQHFYRARIRAVETGRMMLRNGNTGVSALIDPLGRIQDQLGPWRRGVVRGRLARPLQPPLYTRWGDWITLLVAGALGIRGWFNATQPG